MTLWKTALCLALGAALSACSATGVPLGDGASSAPVTSRSARTLGTLSSMDVVRSVQSSL